MQRDCYGPKLQALQKGCPLPRESLVARFNTFLEDGFLLIGGRLQFADLSRKLIHPLYSIGLPFHSSVDHADAHSSSPLASSHCAVGIARGSLDIAGSGGNQEGLGRVPAM